MIDSNSKDFNLYIPFEFVCICKFKPNKPILVYKSKAGDIYLSRRKTSDKFYGSVYINSEKQLYFPEDLCNLLNIEENDVFAIYVRRKRLFLDLVATKR